MSFRTKFKCDVIIYSKTAAIGLIYFPQCHEAPIEVFSQKAKDCPANNFLFEWKPSLLKKVLAKAKYFKYDELITRDLFFIKNGSIEKSYWQCIAEIYKESGIDLDKENKCSEQSGIYNIMDTIQKSFKKLFSRSSESSILFKQVHCTKYIKKIPCSFLLEWNELDNHFYYINRISGEETFERPCKSFLTWKPNIKYKLVEKEFSGTVVKIETIPFVAKLGTYKSYDIYKRYLYDKKIYKKQPIKMDNCYIPVATVYYQNGRKRRVPLSCIKEYECFDNGTIIEDLLSNLRQVQENNLKTKISIQKGGSIKVEKILLWVNEDYKIKKIKQCLILNVKERSSYTYFGNKAADDIFFNISDDEYEKIFDIMKNQIKEECGFIPDLVYGQTNFDRLINFARYPFAPELNEFTPLFNKLPLSGISKDYNGKECVHPFGIEEELSHSPDCVRKFIRYCGLPYKPRIIKELLEGHRFFAVFLEAWKIGFRDPAAIDILMVFGCPLADIVFQKGAFCDYVLTEAEMILGQKDFSVENFTFVENLQILEYIKFLFKPFDEITCAKLAGELLLQDSMSLDTFNYFQILFNENALSEAIIKKIGKEGFTSYNHDMLMRIYRQAHPEEKEQCQNQKIIYSQDEEKLQWEKNGYKFCLPEDTDRLVDIGYRMNICVGHLYRDKAATKECIIVYAIKENEYELCIEIQKKDEQHFKLIQKSAFSNHPPKGELLKTFNEWCLQKGVV